jgi:tRNA(Ser,Leu) C12 N-acetylase TAN1
VSDFAVTCTPYFKRIVMKELKKVDEHCEIVMKFSDGVFLVRSSFDSNVFLKELLKLKPVFIKHICPA